MFILMTLTLMQGHTHSWSAKAKIMFFIILNKLTTTVGTFCTWPWICERLYCLTILCLIFLNCYLLLLAFNSFYYFQVNDWSMCLPFCFLVCLLGFVNQSFNVQCLQCSLFSANRSSLFVIESAPDCFLLLFFCILVQSCCWYFAWVLSSLLKKNQVFCCVLSSILKLKAFFSFSLLTPRMCCFQRSCS